ncbi:KxYKxGKxW signal peptide domain-containing protein, partial [Holdemanella sp. DFI.5.55]|nr:KxYKxGKxW signal peptide domain-containing protein [Holdemanella sp. DFI.5.55]
MDVRKHYKMFKKGKKWCCMALTTVAVAAGTLMATQTVNADTVSDANNVS